MYSNNEVDKKRTGDKIYQLIHESDFTFEEISERLGLCSKRSIYFWVNGEKLPTVGKLILLSVLLNVKVEDIIVLDDVFILY